MSRPPRVIVITGGTSGIGKATALRTSAAGDHVTLVARGQQALQKTADECATAGAASVHPHSIDVGDDAQVAEVFEHVVQQHGRLDAVIHCAGVVAYGRTEDVPVEVFDAVVRTNLLGSVNVARHALPIMRRQRAGSIVLVGSVIGHLAVPSMSPYVLSKWGVRALARQLQIENRDLPDVSISYVAPGGVDTPIYTQAANYQGVVGRPPPPVADPDTIAEVLLTRIDHPRPRTQIGIANDVMLVGFTALPWVFDLLVGPLFSMIATDRNRPVTHSTGNVLQPRDAGNELRGGHESPLTTLGRKGTALLKGLTRRTP